MAFSQCVRSPAPAKCRLCETDRPIKWKCIDCNKFLCDHCKEEVHPELKKTENHQIVNIKDVGQKTVVDLYINKQYQSELSVVGHISHSHGDSLWICSKQDEVLQKVKPDGTKLNILSSFNIRVLDMAVTQSNNLLVSTGESRLVEISNTCTGTPSYTVYNLSQLHLVPVAVHITNNNKILVGGIHRDFPKQGRRVVILMNQNGRHERVYEHDQHQQPIFTYPWRITSTSNRNIHVLDAVSGARDRVVVLGQDGDIINTYTCTGDKEINKDIQFYPGDIVTTPTDNVIVADPSTNTLHILNNAGLPMAFYKTSDINIKYQLSLAFSPTGQLYIGCNKSSHGTKKDAKIYEVTILGC